MYIWRIREWHYDPENFRLVLRLLFVFVLVISSSGYAQELEYVQQFKIKKPAAASLDRQGSLILADYAGTINKYDSNGDLILSYSAPKNSKVGLIEAWSTLDVLVFYSGFQSVTILNRFLAPITEIDLQDNIGFARLATFNTQSNLWVIDDLDFSLKLLDLKLDQVTINTPFNQVLDRRNYEITYLREYQNQLFIVDSKSGIIVFDNLGNYLRTIPAKGLDFLGFLNNELYYTKDDSLIFEDIYSGDKRELLLPTIGLVLSAKSHIYIVSEDAVNIYSY